jgi:signal transduction histidine kinase
VKHSRLGGVTGHNRELWPVLLLLLLAVLIPTVCLLWFMNEAMNNQRQAAAQQLTEAYRTQVSLIRERLERYWERSLAALEEQSRERSGGALFAQCVRSGLADSAICFAEGKRLSYPAPPAAPATDPALERSDWREAMRLEESSPTSAPDAYAAIAESATDPVLCARAWQAQGRCLVRAGKRDAAIRLVVERLERSQYGQATDLQGRLIAADAALMALQLMSGPQDKRFVPVARRLRALLLDYDSTPLSSSQRLFLMREMQALKLPSELVQFPTFQAEQLTAQYLEAEQAPVAEPNLQQAAVPGIWKLGSTNGRVVALLRTETVHARIGQFLSEQKLATHLHLVISQPGAPVPEGQVLESQPAGMRLPGWQATLLLADPKPFEQLAQRQKTVYLWIGALFIAAMSIAALLAARLLRRQVRLARLKTDLVASVSHELKTPLSSMRLFVDTLLEETQFDQEKTRQYLELVARENARLSRLIESFLTFSRMERNTYSFEFADTDAARIVAEAVEAAGERFRTPECLLHVKVDPGLPRVRADSGALVTVLLNLLDNAYKYSPGEKRIALRAYAENQSLCFEVEDHGIGLSPRECKKIFRKFYQVDQRLARTSGGCGLGLSIIQFIVKAHGGSVGVTSQAGRGSIFRVQLPCERT